MHKDCRKGSEGASICNAQGRRDENRRVGKVFVVIELSISDNLTNVIFRASAIKRDRSGNREVGSIEGVRDWNRIRK